MRIESKDWFDPFVPVWALHEPGSGKAAMMGERTARRRRSGEKVVHVALPAEDGAADEAGGAKVAGCAATFSAHDYSTRRRGGWRGPRGGSQCTGSVGAASPSRGTRLEVEGILGGFGGGGMLMAAPHTGGLAESRIVLAAQTSPAKSLKAA